MDKLQKKLEGWTCEGQMGFDDLDWVDDSTMPEEETRRRFDELKV